MICNRKSVHIWDILGHIWDILGHMWDILGHTWDILGHMICNRKSGAEIAWVQRDEKLRALRLQVSY